MWLELVDIFDWMEIMTAKPLRALTNSYCQSQTVPDGVWTALRLTLPGPRGVAQPLEIYL